MDDGSRIGDVYLLKGELLIESDRRSDRHLVGGAAEVDMTTIGNFVDQRSYNKLPPFFGIKKFPVSTFAIAKVETGNDGNTKVPTDGNIKVTGNLTMQGITKAVTFPAKMHFTDGMDGTVEMNGILTIDRTDWGIDNGSEKLFFKSGDGTIADDIKLFMKIVAKK